MAGRGAPSPEGGPGLARGRGDSIAWSKPEDLKPYVVGTIRTLPAATSLPAAGVKVDLSDDTNSLFSKLQARRIDLAILTDLTAEGMMAPLSAAEKAKFKPLAKPWSLQPLSAVYNTNKPEGVEFGQYLEKGMKVIVANGTYLAILEKYYGKGKVPADVMMK